MEPNPSDSGILAQLQALREQVTSLQATLDNGFQLRLSPVQPRSFLGQPVTLVATVTDRGGQRPQVGLPITLVTTWGKLQLPGKNPKTAGQTLSTVSGLDGTTRITLLPPTGEDLLPSQEAALEVMLRNLDPRADSPTDTKKGLVEMVNQYRWEVNTDFRGAVDVYFADLGQKLLETINSQDFMGDWNQIPVTVMAYTGESGGSVAASAVLPLTFKNWLGPWLQTYREITRKANTLDSDLEDLANRGTEPVTVLNNIYDFVQTYVNGERGKAGQYLGRQIAQNSLHNLLDTGLDKLPLATQIAIFPAVQATGQVVAQVGLSTAAVAHQTEATLSHQVIGKGRLTDLGDIVKRLGDAEAKLTTTIDQQTLADALTSKVDQVTLNEALATKIDQQTLTDALASKVDTVALNDALVSKVDQQTFTDALATKIDREALTDGLATKVDNAAFNDALANKVDTTVFKNALTDKVDTVTFNTALVDKVNTVEFNNAVAGKVDTVAFNDSLANKVDLTALNDGLANKVDLEAFKNSLADKVDAATFNTGLANKVDSVDFNKALAETVTADKLQEALKGKVNAAQFEKFQGSISARLENVVDRDTFSDTIKGLATKDDVAKLRDIIGRKVNVTDFNQALAQKADTSQVIQIQNDLTTRLDTKADNDQLTRIQTDLQGSINAKADSITIDQLTSTVNTGLKDLRDNVSVIRKKVFQ